MLNILPVGLIALVILGVTRRSLLSFVWIVSLVGFLFYVNILKFSELQEPLVTADFLLIGQVVTGFDLLGRYVDIPKLVVAMHRISCALSHQLEMGKAAGRA